MFVPCEQGVIMFDDEIREIGRLTAWWIELEPKKRMAAISRRPGDPMPPWMVSSLKAAGVSGLVDQSGEHADVVAPWVPMPEHVAEFIGVRRWAEVAGSEPVSAQALT
jgi:hypothetical protein